MSRDNYNIELIIDLDGVIANFAVAAILKSGGPPPYISDLIHYHHDVVVGQVPELSRPEIHDLIEPYPNAREALKGLRDSGYTIHICTSRAADTKEYTLNWLKDWQIPFDKFSVDTPKHEVGGKVLFEDYPRHAQMFAATRRPVLLFRRPWNNDFSDTVGPPIYSVHNWIEAVECLRYLNVQGRIQ